MAVKYTPYFTKSIGKVGQDNERKAQRLCDCLFDMLSDMRDRGEIDEVADGKQRELETDYGVIRYSYDGTDTELKNIFLSK